MPTTPQALAPSALATALLLCPAGNAAAMQDVASSTGALKRLSIEELMDIEVTSVSRSAETLSSAAAAVAVVTNEDIRRSGATTIPGGVARRARSARRAAQLQLVGGELARIQQHQHGEVARAERYAEHLHPAVVRRLVGRAGLPPGRHRAYRGHPRSGRKLVGFECGQWRDQHHDQARAQHAGRAAQRDRRHRRGGQCGRALRRQVRRIRLLSRVRPILRPGRDFPSGC